VDDESLRVLIVETVKRALAKAQIPSLRPGTVTATTGTYPMVLVDGDIEASQIPSICGTVFTG
jgi:hypothetical protein